MAKKLTYEELEQRVLELEKEAGKRMQAEMALRESEERLSQIIHGSSVPTLVIDNNHVITHCNRAFENLMGIPAEKLVGTHGQWLEPESEEGPFLADFIVDGAPEEEMAWYYHRKCRRSSVAEGAYEAEAFFPQMGKGGKWFILTAAPLLDAEGNVTGAVETLVDITERRKAEEALEESEKRLTQIVQGSSIPTFVIDNNHMVTHCNRAFENLKGITAEKIIGTRSQWAVFYTSERPVLADLIIDGASEEEIDAFYEGVCRKSAVAEGAWEAEVFFPDLGEEGQWFFITAAPLLDDEGNISGAVETLQDVTERRRAEEALREEEKRLSQMVRGSSIPTFVIDNNHMVTHCNRAFENLRGITAGEIVGTRNQWSVFYSTRRPVLADFIVDQTPAEKISRYYGGKCRKSLVADGAYEVEAFYPDLGEKGQWFFITASPLHDDDGAVTGAIETLQDVTERRRAEDALRRSERRYKTLLDFIPYPIVVFTLEGYVSYLNPAFTEIFGWRLSELEGKRIPYVPRDYEQETEETIHRFFLEKGLERHETKRLTRDGRVLDVALRAAFYSGIEDPGGEIVILRDITREKRAARNNEAILRISMALPEYPDLEDLLDYVSREVKRLLNTEGSLVILHDQEKQELFFLGAAYDDSDTTRRAKESRFTLDQLVAGKVIRTGKPLIVSDTSEDVKLHQERDRRLGYQTRNLLLVPLRSHDRIIGVLCAINRKQGDFEQSEVELLNMIAGTVALSIENARFAEEVKRAYREVSSMNRAKDKVIHHLSHELKTPVAVLAGSLNILARRLAALPAPTWQPTLERAQRNLGRIVEIEDEVDDIMRERQYEAYELLSQILDRCVDEMETLVAEETGEGPIVERIRDRIEDIFGPKEMVPERIPLHDFVAERIEAIGPSLSHRAVDILPSIETVPPVLMPLEPLQKVVDGLLKNAVENTPDEGKVEIVVRRERDGALLLIRDYGVGIVEDAQRRIFEGFFATQETMDYSSKRPFDFNAGGKGADLLRMKIFSERYGFEIDMASERCRYIPLESDVCPGRIGKCASCKSVKDCHESGGTTFSVYFPPAP
ncbi:MAG: PAS domain S-box protein [Deltaproteobacteria bacterium]|nr:PAS domain S-box protein [Deltaproteobacteria bacterium]